MSTPGGPPLRIGDAEREAAVTALGEHYAAGRLTKEEYDERSDRAYAARTASDLWPLFADLPGPAGSASGGSASQAWGGSSGRTLPPRPGWRPGALVPVVVVLGVLTVLTHLPFLLLLLVGWLLWSSAFRGHGGPRWHGGPHGGGYRGGYRGDDTRRW